MSHTLPENYLLNNRYSIAKVIGQGGFGITYLAKDEVLNMQVCLKELFVSGSNTRGSNQTVLSQASANFSFGDFVQRFIEEARQLAKFKQPNIVRVLDVFQENQTAYMVMEYVEGETLKERVTRQGAIGSNEAFPIMLQLFDAIEAVHKAGMLHRDIKPDNILICKDNKVVLIDFGSAREFTDGKTTTQTAILTPGYAPPEQYSDRAKRGSFTDIYALGATFYFMLTGTKPLAITDRVNEQMPAPHEIDPKVGSQISSAIMLALQLKPESRFQSVEEFRKVLKAVLLFNEKKANPISSVKEVPRNTEGNKLPAGAIRDNKQRAKNAILSSWLLLGSYLVLLITTNPNNEELRYLIAPTVFVFFILFALSIINFIKWFRRAYYNLGTKLGGMKHKDEIVLVSTIVPVLNLFLPFLMMKELFSKTEKLYKDNRIPVPKNLSMETVDSWWVFYLLAAIFPFVSSFSVENSGGPLPIIILIEAILITISVVLSIRMIKRYSAIEPLLRTCK